MQQDESAAKDEQEFKLTVRRLADNVSISDRVGFQKRLVRQAADNIDISDNVEAKIRFETVDGIIVLLDALGIKGVWKTRNPADVTKNWELLYEEYTMEIKSLKNKLQKYGSLKETKFETFSDTIMLSLPIDKRDVGSDQGRSSSWWSIMLTGEILIKLVRISIQHDFLFRGCLSMGTFYRSPNMIIGPAVDEAAEYYNLPQWGGISTCPSASQVLTETEEMKASIYDFFIQYDIPVKNSIEKNGWALNWPLIQSNNQINNADLRKILYDRSKTTSDSSACSKIKNTLAFYDWVHSKGLHQ